MSSTWEKVSEAGLMMHWIALNTVWVAVDVLTSLSCGVALKRQK